MKPKQDSSGNVYFDVGNIRITATPSVWGGNQKGLRIQAYKGQGKALHPGAELPVPDKETAFDLVNAIMQALQINETSK